MAFVNPRNQVTEFGVIPRTESITYEFYPSKTDKDTGDCMLGSIDVYRGYKDKDGNPVMDLFGFKAYGSDARYMRDYIHRGDHVTIAGSLQVDIKENNGKKEYRTFIKVNGIVSVQNGNNNNNSQDNSSKSSAPAANPFAKKPTANPFARNALK